MTFGQRFVIAVSDAAVFSSLIPVAFWSAFRFPFDRPPRFAMVAVHALIGIAGSVAWILVVASVAMAVTGLAMTPSLILDNLAWLSSNLFAYFLLVLAIHALTSQRRLVAQQGRSLRLQAQLSIARLDTLKAQLQPHFLFNTLHSISELIHIDPARADRMIIRLSQLLRESLKASAAPAVTLRHELEVVEAYLDLQKMRHGDRLRVRLEIEPRTLDALVPPLLLQPLVENALRHGLAPRAAPGMIVIGATAENGFLRLTISDDGVGLHERAKEGIGLANTRERLREAYGTEQQLTIVPRDGGGTVAAIVLPLDTMPVSEGHDA
jgi:two-component system, LytTR family, sensor kinase